MFLIIKKKKKEMGDPSVLGSDFFKDAPLPSACVLASGFHLSRSVRRLRGGLRGHFTKAIAHKTKFY